MTTQTYTGGCHCGAVRFEAELDLANGGSMCNCTICVKIAAVTQLIKPAAFRLIAGEASLLSYEWGSRSGQRKFCKHCGVHSFATGTIEELGGAYVSVHLNALDAHEPSSVAIKYWDGRHNNWEAGTRTTPWPIHAPPA
jgi:hypothetical protein